MATDTHVRRVEEIIGYSFKTPNYLVQALTAAGADEQNHDGNRKLAQLGESLIEFVVLDNAYTAEVTRGDSLSQEWHLNLLTPPRRRK